MGKIQITNKGNFRGSSSNLEEIIIFGNASSYL